MPLDRYRFWMSWKGRKLLVIKFIVFRLTGKGRSPRGFFCTWNLIGFVWVLCTWLELLEEAPFPASPWATKMPQSSLESGPLLFATLWTYKQSMLVQGSSRVSEYQAESENHKQETLLDIATIWCCLGQPVNHDAQYFPLKYVFVDYMNKWARGLWAILANQRFSQLCESKRTT